MTIYFRTVICLLTVSIVTLQAMELRQQKSTPPPCLKQGTKRRLILKTEPTTSESDSLGESQKKRVRVASKDQLCTDDSAGSEQSAETKQVFTTTDLHTLLARSSQEPIEQHWLLLGVVSCNSFYIELALKNGACLTKTYGPTKGTVLHLAALIDDQNKQERITIVLDALTKGIPAKKLAAFIDKQDEAGNTALHYAVLGKTAQDVALLNANDNAENAAPEKAFSGIESLVKAGARCDIPNPEGKTAMTINPCLEPLFHQLSEKYFIWIYSKQ